MLDVETLPHHPISVAELHDFLPWGLIQSVATGPSKLSLEGHESDGLGEA